MQAKDQRKKQPLAIVGIGCRFPGDGDTPDNFWQVLRNGVDTFSDVPENRWSKAKFLDRNVAVPGTAINFQGGFLSGSVYDFDADFFGISPREAARLDPQQRLLAEVTWEALEDAGIAADQLAGSPVGVYVGGFTIDNLVNEFSLQNRDAISPHTSTGVSLGMLANRVSYLFDFRGPSVTIDTACSSSLVALNYACRDLWSGECSLAVAAGVNLMLRPEFPIAMSKGGFLSPDSRSKAFDARANGYARGEGGGVVVIKPLDQAQAAGDHIYAVIRGTGVNQDGRTSGITVPNPEAQESLIRKVYNDFDILPDQIAYIEAHGTGTPVGDPIETGALGRALNKGAAARRDILIGSVKANIGHLEAAAGIAATIKAALILHNRKVPPQINFETPNPNIPFADLGLKVPVSLEDLPQTQGPQSVSINSFGFGGANAHAVLAVAPDVIPLAKRAFDSQRPCLLPISAKNPDALTALATAYRDQIGATADLTAMASAAAQRRSHLSQRLAILASDAQTTEARLTAFLDGTPDIGVITGRTAAAEPREVVFAFTGMGPQWWAMGRALYQSHTVFRMAVDAADQAFKAVSGWSILAEMLADEDASRMAENQIAQPANFVLQVGLAALWRDWGIRPAAIVGHSVGEITAAYVAGALSLEDAASVSFHRSQSQQKMAGLGGMLAASVSADVAAELLTLFPGKLSLAAINAPSSVAIAGDLAALGELSALLDEEGIFNRMLTVEVAYHSHQMNGLEAELKAALKGLKPRPPAVPLWSTVTGQQVRKTSHDAEYWWQNVRQPVRLADAIRSLGQDGYGVFLEVGPHPVLAPAIKETLAASGGAGETFGSLRRGKDEADTMAAGLAGLYCAGAQFDWTALFGAGCDYQKLPLYPWQKQTFSSETEWSHVDRLGIESDPMLGMRVDDPKPRWTSPLTHSGAEFLKDHVVDGAIVFPGAGYAQIMLAAQRDLAPDHWGVVEDIGFLNAMVFGDDDKPVLRTEITEATGQISVHGRLAGLEGGWTLCSQARLSQARPRVLTDKLDLTAMRKSAEPPLDIAALYDMLARRGLRYGPCFKGLVSLARLQDGVLAEIQAHPSIALDAAYPFIHPTMLDAAFQALIAGLDTDADGFDPAAVFVPVTIKRLSLLAPVGRRVFCFGRVLHSSPYSFEGEITLCDQDGSVLAKIEGFRCQAVPRAEQANANPLENAFYAYEWHATDPAPIQAAIAEHWLLVAEASDLATDITKALVAQGGTFTWVSPKGGEGDTKVSFDTSDDTAWQTFLTQTEDVQFDRAVFLADDGIDDAGTQACLTLAALTRHLTLRSNATDTRLLVLSQGNGDAVTGDTSAGLPGQFALTGLARVIANEHPDLGCRLIDVGADRDRADLTDILQEILSLEAAEDEVALRPGQRYVHRLERRDPQKDDAATEVLRDSLQPFRLDQPKKGEINSMRFIETPRVPPADDQVEVRIVGASLNFKDILKLTGVLTDEVVNGTFFAESIGMEAAIEVVATGRNATRYKPGQRMVATLPNGCIRAYTTVAERDIHGVPELPGHDLMALAGVPTAFVTAYYALVRIANMQPGEKVLLHSATGGVGLAAIQVARLLGVEIYATAGTEDKRAYLKSLGVEHVFNSRSLDFADDVRAASRGYGVDVVLNFLPGEAQDKGMSLLAPFGRFIEIGKRDIEENRGLGLRPFNHNLQFTAIDIDRMLAEKPAMFDDILAAVWDEISKGNLSPVPITTFPIADFAQACHHMRRAEARGKVIVKIEGETLPVVPDIPKTPLCRADGSYLVTGGFGGFGLKVAEWLVDQGAGQLVLAGRSGATSDDAKRVVAGLKKRGIGLREVRLDVADPKAVDDLLAKLATGDYPLKGIYHAAGVLEDRLLCDMAPDHFRKVMGPKAVGAWNLHQACQQLGLALDQFVLFSSISALVGNPGQGNYAAANTFLDGLATYRRHQGLAASSINWGALAEIGMAAQDAKVEDRLNQIGVKSLPPAAAIAALEVCLRQDMARIGVMQVDWSRWRQTNPVAANAAKFSGLVSLSDSGNDTKSAVVANLLVLEPAARIGHVTGLLASAISEVLRLPVDRLDINLQLSDMGVDSLMMVDVQIASEKALGVDVTVMELSRGGSVARLAADLLARLLDGVGDAVVAPVAKAKNGAAAPEVKVDDLSDEEVDRMLQDMRADSEVFAK